MHAENLHAVMRKVHNANSRMPDCIKIRHAILTQNVTLTHTIKAWNFRVALCKLIQFCDSTGCQSWQPGSLFVCSWLGQSADHAEDRDSVYAFALRQQLSGSATAHCKKKRLVSGWIVRRMPRKTKSLQGLTGHRRPSEDFWGHFLPRCLTVESSPRAHWRSMGCRNMTPRKIYI
jgi:hypothetical protein